MLLRVEAKREMYFSEKKLWGLLNTIILLKEKCTFSTIQRESSFSRFDEGLSDPQFGACSDLVHMRFVV